MAVSTRHLLDSLKPIVTFRKFDPSNVTFANGPQVTRGLFICLFIYLFIYFFIYLIYLFFYLGNNSWTLLPGSI